MDDRSGPGAGLNLYCVAVLTLMLVTGCVPGGSAGGGGGGGDDDDARVDPTDADVLADVEVDAAIPDLGRVDVGDDCEPSEELCNGEDDDCDGVVDNGFEGLRAACTVGEGVCAAEGVQVCSADGTTIECDATAGEPGVEACNGLDDDCDGVVDNDFDVGQPCAEGVGACAVEGVTVCTEDGDVVCGAQAGSPADETCDAADNDCDGTTDEGLEAAPCETGLPGVCGAGTGACVDGEVQCTPSVEPGEEVCDGLDNDCDGEVDDVEGLGGACIVGIGGCAAPGVTICGEEGLLCDGVPGRPLDEICDGQDNDCDGEVDDVEGLGALCEVGVGACAAQGFTICGPDGVRCDADPGPPQIEVCDGIDNDCNGVMDDVEGLGDGCTVGAGPCSADGALVCTPEGLACDAEPLPGAPEVCDGEDNDCNGVVDDVPGVGGACVAGIGACLSDGTLTCGEGGLTCDAVPGVPTPEVCDNLDNDCNGVVDDPPVCVVPEDCANGVDDDGDGATDCADAECVGDPACAVAGARGTLLLCGQSARDMAALIEPGDGLVFAAGCAPDGDTRAMLVSRTGAASADGPTWSAYVAAGGRIISEYDSTDDVYNAVFGTNERLGGQTGSCRDQVNPAIRLNLGDRFWLDNGALGVAPGANSGCGHDISAWADIVPLGGHTAGRVHLAYRDLGAGRVYLVEADWQDDNGEPPEYFSDNSRALMRYMILDGAAPVDPGPGEPVQVGRFDVADGPPYQEGEALALSCVEACARLFGGQAGDYGCSTVDGEYNGRAFVTTWGDRSTCDGDGVAEDFVVPEEGAPYDCGMRGCATSAYVSDNCPNGVTNFCWSLAGGPQPEVCDNGIDDDGDGDVDCDDADCAPAPECLPVPGGFVPGVQQNVSEAELAARGWVQCFQGRYNGRESIDDLLAGCPGEHMLIGCRRDGDADISLAAEGLTAEITRDIGPGRNDFTAHNDVAFYFDPDYSWGFAPLALGVSRNSCDTGAESPELRMCWHADPGNLLSSGYRCGRTGVASNLLERFVYTRQAPP